MIKGIVFDLDGTLVNLSINWKQLKQDIEDSIGFYPKLDQWPLLTNIEKRLVYRILERHELSGFNRTTPKARSMQYYNVNIANGLKIGLVTMNGKRIVDKLLNRYSLIFDSIVTRENIIPRDRQLEKTLENLDLKHTEVIFIGNKLHDKLAADKLMIRYRDVNEL